MTDRQLNAKGRGEYTYDYAHDVLLFKIKDRTYRESIEFNNITIDIDAEGFITGIQIFDASTALRIPKYALQHIVNFEFNSRAENGTITVQVHFNSVLRNKMIMNKTQDIQRDAPFAVQEPRTVEATA
jgi:uncharacterized protein YuzE